MTRQVTNAASVARINENDVDIRTEIELLRAVLKYGLMGEAPLLTELGVDPVGVSELALRYEPLPGTDMGDLPRVLEVPLP